MKREILNKSLEKIIDGAEVMIVSTNKGTFAGGSSTEITNLLGTIVASLAINDSFDEEKLRVAINKGFEIAKSLRANKGAIKSQNFTDFLNDLFRD